MLLEKEFSLHEIRDVAQFLLAHFTQKIIVFEGEMGAGKTTLIKEICHLMGVKNLVNSPTYSIVNEYVGAEKIYHFDLFRLKNTREALDFGIEEYLDSGYYCFVEWFEPIKPLITDTYNWIKLEKTTENTRKITFVTQ
jgi:tRNA threonylcarbamoyladenosine biosynthesis protein TsaE